METRGKFSLDFSLHCCYYRKSCVSCHPDRTYSFSNRPAIAQPLSSCYSCWFLNRLIDNLIYICPNWSYINGDDGNNYFKFFVVLGGVFVAWNSDFATHSLHTHTHKNTKAIVYSWSQFQLQVILGSLLFSQFHEAKRYILAHFIPSGYSTSMTSPLCWPPCDEVAFQAIGLMSPHVRAEEFRFCSRWWLQNTPCPSQHSQQTVPLLFIRPVWDYVCI